ncbi:MAG: acyl-CoA dehydrogenase family protein, partial [Paracoccaceae bacterium]
MAELTLGMTDKLRPIHDAVVTMIRDEIAPLDAAFLAEVSVGDRWQFTPRQTEILEGLKSSARAKGLWNIWLTDSASGAGLNTVEYAYLAEECGKSHLAAEVFNCSAPDTGNMEVFERYGSDAHKEKWLVPLLDGT